MKHNSSPKLRPTGWDAIVALAVLLLAIGTAVVFYSGLGSSSHVTATITHKGEVVDKVILSALNEEKTVTIDGTYHLTIALTEEGVVCQFDSRGGANTTEENYARVIDAALQAEGFTVEQSEMDAAHYVPPTAKIVEDMAALYREVRGMEPAIVSQVAGSYAHFVDGAIAVGRAEPGVDCRIHKTDEWLPLADLDRLVELLALSIVHFCE